MPDGEDKNIHVYMRNWYPLVTRSLCKALVNIRFGKLFDGGLFSPLRNPNIIFAFELPMNRFGNGESKDFVEMFRQLTLLALVHIIECAEWESIWQRHLNIRWKRAVKVTINIVYKAYH